eukprot:jgi/Mesvir1/19908/Mv25393-RA.1
MRMTVIALARVNGLPGSIALCMPGTLWASLFSVSRARWFSSWAWTLSWITMSTASGRCCFSPRAAILQDLKVLSSSAWPLLASECGTLRGKLNWLACTTSPDLAVLSRLPDNVLCLIDRAVIVQYLLASPGLMLQGVDWDKPVELVSYCDSSLDARVLTKMRGSCAAVTTICNADQPTMSSIFAWYSHLHRRVYVGSDTAEARAYCEAASELSYFHALICWILAVGGTTPHLRRVIRTDSQAVVDFIENPYARTRDLDFLRVKEFSDCVSTQHVPGERNYSDALTKLYSSAKAQYPLLRHTMNRLSLGQSSSH